MLKSCTLVFFIKVNSSKLNTKIIQYVTVFDIIKSVGYNNFVITIKPTHITRDNDTKPKN